MGTDDVSLKRYGDCEHCLESVAGQLEDFTASKGQMARIMLDAHGFYAISAEYNRKEFSGYCRCVRSHLASSGLSVL